MNTASRPCISTRRDVKRLLKEHFQRVHTEFHKVALSEAMPMPPEMQVFEQVFGSNPMALIQSLESLFNNGVSGLITITSDQVPFGQAFGFALAELYGPRHVRLAQQKDGCRALRPRDTEFFAPYYLALRLEFIDVEKDVNNSSKSQNRVVRENIYGSEAVTVLCMALMSPEYALGKCEGPQDIPSTLAKALLRNGGDPAKRFLMNRLQTPEARGDPLVQTMWNNYLRVGVEPLRQHLHRNYLIRIMESRGALRRLEVYDKLMKEAQKRIAKERARVIREEGDVPPEEAPLEFLPPDELEEEEEEGVAAVSISSREEERIQQQVLQTEAEAQIADLARPMPYELAGFQRPARELRVQAQEAIESPLVEGEPVYRSMRMAWAIQLQLEAKFGRALHLQFPDERAYDSELRSAFSLVMAMLEEWDGFSPLPMVGDDASGYQLSDEWQQSRRKHVFLGRLLQWMPHVARLVQRLYRPSPDDPVQEHPDVLELLNTYDSCRALEPLLKDMGHTDKALHKAKVDETRHFSSGTFVRFKEEDVDETLRRWTNSLMYWQATCLMAFRRYYWSEALVLCAMPIEITAEQVLRSISILNRRFYHLHLFVDNFERDGHEESEISLVKGTNHEDLLPASRRTQKERDDHVCVINTLAGCYMVFSSRGAMMRYNHYGMLHEALSRRRPKLYPYFPQALRLYSCIYREPTKIPDTDLMATDDLHVFIEGLFCQLMRCSLACEMPDDKTELQPLNRPDIRLRPAMLLPTHERFIHYRMLHGLMARMKRCMHLFPFMSKPRENQSVQAQHASFLHTCDTIVGFLLLRAPHLVPAYNMRRVYDYLHSLKLHSDPEKRKLWYRHIDLYYYLWHVKKTLSHIYKEHGVEDVYRMKLECDRYITVFIFPYIYTRLGLEKLSPLLSELADVKNPRHQDKRVEVHLRMYRFCADPDVDDDVAYRFLMSIRYEYDAIAPYRAKQLWRQVGAMPDRVALKNMTECLDAMHGLYQRHRHDELAGAEPDKVLLQNHGTVDAPELDRHTPFVLAEIKRAALSDDPLQHLSAKLRGATYFGDRPTQPVGQQLLRTERNTHTPWYFLRREPVFRGDNDCADEAPSVLRPLYLGMRTMLRTPNLYQRFCVPGAQEKFYSKPSLLAQHGGYKQVDQQFEMLEGVSRQPLAEFLSELEWFLYDRSEPPQQQQQAPEDDQPQRAVTFAVAPYTDEEQKSPWKLDAEQFLGTEQINTVMPTRVFRVSGAGDVQRYNMYAQDDSLWLSLPPAPRATATQAEDHLLALQDPEPPIWDLLEPVAERTQAILSDITAGYSKRFSLLLKRVRDSPVPLQYPEMVLQTATALRLRKVVEPFAVAAAAPVAPAGGSNRRAFVKTAASDTPKRLLTAPPISALKRPRMAIPVGGGYEPML